MENSEIFVARQPIFNRRMKVYGYELLFRGDGPDCSASISDADTATGHVMSASYLNIGIEELTAGKPAFINFTRELLVSGVPEILPSEQTVVEVLENIEPDLEVLEALDGLKKKGYKIALDDIVYLRDMDKVIDFADIIKIDFLATNSANRIRLVNHIRRVRANQTMLLAEKVEDHQIHNEALEQGFDLYQGYFFRKPEVLKGRRIPESKVAYLRLLQSVHDPSLDFAQMEEIIKSDIALTSKLLRYINVAAFPWSRRIASVHRALLLLGESQVKKWVSLVALANLAADKPRELAVMSSCRGKFLEELGRSVSNEHTDLEYFLLGALSTLEAMLDIPIEEALNQLPLAEGLHQALCGEQNFLRELLDLAIAYEKGDWKTVAKLSQTLDIEESILPILCEGAVVWSDHILPA